MKFMIEYYNFYLTLNFIYIACRNEMAFQTIKYM